MKKALVLIPLWGLFLFFWLSPYYRSLVVAEFYSLSGSPVNAIPFLEKAIDTSTGFYLSGDIRVPAQRLYQLASTLDVLQNPEAIQALMGLFESSRVHASIQDIGDDSLALLHSSLIQLVQKEGLRPSISVLEQMERRISDSSVPLYLKASAMEEGQNLRKAVELYLLCIEKDPLIQNAILKTARLLFRLRRYTQAYDLLKRYQSRLEQNWETYSIFGLSAYETGNYVDAVKPLEESLRLKPNDYAASLALGRIGVRLNFPELARFLLDAWKQVPGSPDLGLEYMGFLMESARHRRALEFYRKFADRLGRPGAKRILESAFILADQPLIDRLQEKWPELATQERTRFFSGMLAFREQNDELARSTLEKYVASAVNRPDLKMEALQALADLEKRNQNPAAQRKWLGMLFQLDPSRSDIMLQIAATYSSQKDKLARLKGVLDAVQWYPEDAKVLVKALQILRDMGDWIRILDLTQNREIAIRSPSVGLFLAESYLHLGEPMRALSLYERLTEKHGQVELKGTLLDLKDSAALARRKLENPKRRLKALETIHEELNRQLKRISSTADKNALPPAVSLAPPVRVMGVVSRPYVYAGRVRTRIPAGTNVSIMYPDATADREEGWFLARYENTMHRVHEKYLNIAYWPVEGGAMGQATVENVDQQYSTEAKMRKSFKPGESIEVLAGHRYAPSKTLKLNEESVIQLSAGPQKSWDVRQGTRLYPFFRRDAIQLKNGMEYLNEFEFEDIREIPSEGRQVLFGPSGGGIHVLDVSQSEVQVIYSGQFTAVQKRLNRAERLEKPAYQGYTVIDLNQDNVLDYVSLWQDEANPQSGMLYLLASHERGFDDVLVRTGLKKTPNEDVFALSPIQFLRDLDEDGRVELLIHAIYSVRDEPVSRVFLGRFLAFEEGRLEDVSSRFPAYYETQRQKIRQDIANARELYGEEGYPYRVLTAASLNALKDIEPYRN